MQSAPSNDSTESKKSAEELPGIGPIETSSTDMKLDDPPQLKEATDADVDVSPLDEVGQSVFAVSIDAFSARS